MAADNSERLRQIRTAADKSERPQTDQDTAPAGSPRAGGVFHGRRSVKFRQIDVVKAAVSGRDFADVPLRKPLPVPHRYAAGNVNSAQFDAERIRKPIQTIEAFHGQAVQTQRVQKVHRSDGVDILHPIGIAQGEITQLVHLRQRRQIRRAEFMQLQLGEMRKFEERFQMEIRDVGDHAAGNDQTLQIAHPAKP